jgi:hypothetical protein
MSLFTDSWKRIDRAVMHAKAFTSEWGAFVDPKSYETRIDRKSEGTFVAVGRLLAIPENDLALELGEFFYQLRAALDAVIYKAMEIESFPDLPAKEHSIEFPIYPTDSGKFESSPINKGPFPQELKDWLKSIQPYNAPHSSDSQIVEVGRRLKLLHDCARKDRHRRLHVIAAVPTSLQVDFDPSPGVVITHERPLIANFLENETEFFAFHATGFNQPGAKIELASGITLDISIGEIPGLVGQALIDELNGITLIVRDIINLFEKAYE